MSPLWHLSFPAWQFVVRGSIIYIAILLFLRLGGKRQIGQMGVGEFVAILLISNAVQNAMNGGDNSITGGLILAAVLVALSWLVSFLTYRSKAWETLFEGRPRLLIHQGKLLNKNMDKEFLNVHELEGLLRREGVHSLSDVDEAVLETNGTVSITRKPGKS